MKRMLTVVALALVLAAIVVATAMPAFAKITEETRNPQGHVTQGSAAPEPPQDTDKVNPAGHEPPGQNKGDAVEG
jgi:hypothetical protein